jgi:hypothetical protein
VPARMPKAEATTGLAPKKASAKRPSEVGGEAGRRGSCFGGLTPTFLGEVSELRRPWAIQHEDRRAGLARRSEWNSVSRALWRPAIGEYLSSVCSSGSKLFVAPW